MKWVWFNYITGFKSSHHCPFEFYSITTNHSVSHKKSMDKEQDHIKPCNNGQLKKWLKWHAMLCLQLPASLCSSMLWPFRCGRLSRGRTHTSLACNVFASPAFFQHALNHSEFWLLSLCCRGYSLKWVHISASNVQSNLLLTQAEGTPLQDH